MNTTIITIIMMLTTIVSVHSALYFTIIVSIHGQKGMCNTRMNRLFEPILVTQSVCAA